MSVDRRHFLLAGSAVAGGGFASAAYAAKAAPAIAGISRNVTEFGVEPNSKADQTAQLQQAINELAGAGQPIMLPAGIYNAAKLTVPAQCSIMGVPGQTALYVNQLATLAGNDQIGLFNLFGVNFHSHYSKKVSVHVLLSGASVRIANCGFYGAGATALSLDAYSGSVEALEISGYSDSGILAPRSALTISGCHFIGCGTAVKASSSSSAIVAQNQFNQCGTGVAADGIALVSGNIVKEAKEFGLKLGRGDSNGRVVAQGNLLENCRVGIGVTASGDDIFASLNLIHGAKDGAIRAFDGDKLVGRDLARESSEMYLNLTVAGNVAR
jgi:hypothetical protein